MTIDTQCQYDAMLGMWKDRSFRLHEEDDPIDDNDKLLVLYFQGEKIGSYYKSKLMRNVANIQVLQQHCENYWDNKLRHIVESFDD